MSCAQYSNSSEAIKQLCEEQAENYVGIYRRKKKLMRAVAVSELGGKKSFFIPFTNPFNEWRGVDFSSHKTFWLFEDCEVFSVHPTEVTVHQTTYHTTYTAILILLLIMQVWNRKIHKFQEIFILG